MKDGTVVPFLLVLLVTLTRAQTQGAQTVDSFFGTEECPTQSSASCSYVPGACMCVLNTYTDFSHAILDCTRCVSGDGGNKGVIASIHSQEDNDKLHDLIKQHGVDAWIGLQYSNRPSWYDGSPMNYTNWENQNNQGNMATDYKMVAATGKWRPTANTDENNTVTCRLTYDPPPTTESPPGGPNVALIVGVSAAGVVLVVALVCFLVWRWVRRRRIQEGYHNIAQNMPHDATT